MTDMSGLSTTVAPPAPGAIGRAPEPAPLQDYLTALDAWVRGRRAELDELDAAALAAGRGARGRLRHGAVARAVEGGLRPLPADVGHLGRRPRAQPSASKIATLIWGRLDGHPRRRRWPSRCPRRAGSPTPWPASCAPALAEPGADEAAARIKDLRAQLERIRDQVAPRAGRWAATPTVDRLARPDGAARRRHRAGRARRRRRWPPRPARAGRRDLRARPHRRQRPAPRRPRPGRRGPRRCAPTCSARAAALRRLAATCVRTVEPAPRYAVPDVEALGPVPNTPEAIGPYLDRLGRVGQALTIAQRGLRRRPGRAHRPRRPARAYVAKARALGRRRPGRPRRQRGAGRARCSPASRRRWSSAASSSRPTRPG